MDESFFQIIFYIIIAVIWFLFGGSQKKKPTPKPKPIKKSQPVISDGQPTLADLLNKIQSTKEDPQKSSEIYSDPYQSKASASSYTSTKKDQHLAPYQRKKTNIYVQELLKDKESLRKAFIMSEIFKTKF